MAAPGGPAAGARTATTVASTSVASTRASCVDVPDLQRLSRMHSFATLARYTRAES